MVEIAIAIIGSIASIVTAIISKKTSNKVETIQSLKEDFKKEVNSIKYENDKTYLTDFLSEVEAGQYKSPIQIQRAYEIYEEYTTLNGNSYVRNHWEDLVKKGKL
jgi:hypothetical protein